MLSLCFFTVLGGWAKEYDWRIVGGITPVGDQGSCQGSSMCWAAINSYSTEYWRQTGNLYTLSTEYCLECSGADSCSRDSITHQNMQKIMEFLRDNGAPNSTDYPFTAGNLSSGAPSTSGLCDSSNKVKC